MTIKFKVNGKVVGSYEPTTKVYVRTATAKHMLQFPKAAWAIDKDIVDSLLLMGCKTVRIICNELGGVYEASPVIIVEKGHTFDRGHGVQIALPLYDWARPDDNAGAQNPGTN